VEVRELLDARGRGHHANPVLPFEHHVPHIASPQDHVLEIELRRDAEEEVYVREPEIAVEHEDADALARERDREIGDDVGLADAALAARDRDRAAPRPGRWRRDDGL